MEALLQKLWAISLDKDATTLRQESNFLDEGGDSISAMKMSALARQHDVELTVKYVLQHPQLSEMALQANSTSSSSALQNPLSLFDSSRVNGILATAAAICDIPEDAIHDIYPCTPLQIELFVLTMKKPRA